MNEFEVDEANNQFITMWKAFAGDHPGADLVDRPGLSVFWAENPFGLWNALLLNERVSHAGLLEACLQDAAGYMRSKAQNGRVWLCEDFMSGPAREGLETILAAQHLVFATQLAGMVGDILPLEDRPHPALRFFRTTNADGLQAFAAIGSDAYNVPLETMRAGLFGSGLWTDTAYSYVAVEQDDRPVSAASVLVSNGQLYLALVGTRPDCRRKGFSTATVRHALQQTYLATGLRRTNLHASDAEASVYLEIGYHKTTRFLAYKLAGS